jgi:hypothetical protein
MDTETCPSWTDGGNAPDSGECRTYYPNTRMRICVTFSAKINMKQELSV